MVDIPTLNAEDCWFNYCLIKSKTIKLVFAVSLQHEDWLDQNQDNVSEFSNVSSCRLLCQSVSTIKLQLKCVDLVRSRHHHLIEM